MPTSAKSSTPLVMSTAPTNLSATLIRDGRRAAKIIPPAVYGCSYRP
jgi:hypothetical protein